MTETDLPEAKLRVMAARLRRLAYPANPPVFIEVADQVTEAADALASIRAERDAAVAAAFEECAEIALAIDSGRGNEKEIARAIRNLAARAIAGRTEK